MTMQFCSATNVLAQARYKACCPSHLHAARGTTPGVENNIYDVICVPLVGRWFPAPVERGTENVIYVILLADASEGRIYVGQTTRLKPD